MVVVVIVGMMATIAMPRIGTTVARSRIAALEVVVGSDMANAFALAARTRRPVTLTYDGTTKQLLTKDRASGITLSARYLGQAADLSVTRVTLSPAMGVYLAMRGNRKEDLKSGRQPDENYAREVMQLFTIGLNQLNADGTAKTSGGKTIDTYTLAQITELARVFTGWDFDTVDPTSGDCSYMQRPMKHNAAKFSTRTSLRRSSAPRSQASATSPNRWWCRSTPRSRCWSPART